MLKTPVCPLLRYFSSPGKVILPTAAVESSQSRERTFLGKHWRGLAFVAITVATTGKAAIFIAKADCIIAGKAALFTATVKTSYFAFGVAAAWVPK